MFCNMWTADNTLPYNVVINVGGNVLSIQFSRMQQLLQQYWTSITGARIGGTRRPFVPPLSCARIQSCNVKARHCGHSSLAIMSKPFYT